MIAAYLQMGAAGVQMGTVFVCAEELTAHPAFKQAFIRACGARCGALGADRPGVQGDPGARAGQRRHATVHRDPDRGDRAVPPRRDDLRGSVPGDRALLGRCAAARRGRRRRRERLADGGPERRPGAQVQPVADILAELVEQAEHALARRARELHPQLCRRPDGGLGRAEPSRAAARGSEFSASRMLLKRLVEVVAEPVTPQQRLTASPS